jgi:hypothetical protein
MEEDPKYYTQKLTRSDILNNTKKRVNSLKRKRNSSTAMSSESIMRLYAPIPYNIQHLNKAKKFIHDWNGLPDEYGRSYLSYALDLTVSELFESPEEDPHKETLEHRPLPEDKYWQMRYRLVKLLLSQPMIKTKLTAHDKNENKTPLDYFISSLIEVKKRKQSKEYEKGMKQYLPRIFNVITARYAYVLGNALNDSSLPNEEIANIKRSLCSFPIYLDSVNQADRYIKKISKTKKHRTSTKRKKKTAINRQDRLKKTWAHYVLCLTNETILRNYTLNDHYQIIKMLLQQRPDLSIKDRKNKTPLSEFFTSILILSRQLNLVPKTPQSSTRQTDNSCDNEALHIIPAIYNTLIDHGYNKQLRNAFCSIAIRIGQEDKERLRSLLSVFPIFSPKHVILSSFCQSKAKTSIAKVDPITGQTFLHALANIKNKDILLRHTEMRRCILINALLNNTSRMIITRDNKQKIPLQTLFESLPKCRTYQSNSNWQTALRYIALLLAIETLSKDREEYLRALRAADLTHLIRLFNIQTAPAGIATIVKVPEQPMIIEKSFITDIPLGVLIASLPLLNNLTIGAKKNIQRQEKYNKAFVNLILESAYHTETYHSAIESSSLGNLRLLKDLLVTTHDVNKIQFNRIWIDIINYIEATITIKGNIGNSSS